MSLLGAGCTPNSGLEPKSIEHDGIQRTYSIHVPPTYDGSVPVAVVFVLHGGKGNAQKAAYATGFNDLADRDGFIVVYPEGLYNQWNDGRNASFGNHDVTQVDDVGFISALIDQLAQDYTIDSSRAYATGMSNGGMMTHRLACELSNRLAAVAPVIGAVPEALAPLCTPTRPIPILMINGTDDRLVRWEGGPVVGREKWGNLLSIEQTVALWVDKNGCSSTPSTEWFLDTDPNDGTRVWIDQYAGNADVVFYGIDGGGHTWPGGARYQRPVLLGKVSRDIVASEVIWDFFQQHPMS